MDAILQPLLASPALPEFVDMLNRTLALEHQRRLKFYDELTEDGKFEFINGEVIMHSPAKDRHTAAIQNLTQLISAYVRTRGLGVVRSEKALCVFPRNDYEPDIVFFSTAKAGLIAPDTLKYPIPDFVVEVLSPTTAKIDRGVKFDDYARHGVAEYWIVDPERATVERHVAAAGFYGKARVQRTGSVQSQVIAGFEVPVRAIFNEAANLAALRQLLA